MGLYFVNAVLNGLKGRKPALLWGKQRRLKHLGSNEIAFLSVIANEQPNPGAYGQIDTVCYRDPQSLCELMHMRKSCFHDTRNFLVSLGLLDFRLHDTLPDVSEAGRGMKSYTNVYRIKIKQIRALCGADGRTWQQDVLRVNDKDLGTMTTAQRVALCLANDDSPVRNTDSKVRNADSGVRNTDTNIDSNITNTNTTKQPDAFGGAAFDALVKHVSQACWVEEFVINREILRKTVQGHSPARVNAAIEDFASECLRNRWKSTKAPETRVGLLVSRLKGLPAATEPTEAELQAFKPAQVERDPIMERWESLVDAYRLGELPKPEFKALKTAFLIKFRELGLEHLRVFCCDLPWGFGGNRAEDLCREMPEALSRADHFYKMMAERG